MSARRLPQVPIRYIAQCTVACFVIVPLSVVGHELAHATAACLVGAPLRKITFFADASAPALFSVGGTEVAIGWNLLVGSFSTGAHQFDLGSAALLIGAGALFNLLVILGAAWVFFRQRPSHPVTLAALAMNLALLYSSAHPSPGSDGRLMWSVLEQAWERHWIAEPIRGVARTVEGWWR